MIPYAEEKLDHGICWIAKRHHKYSHRHLYQTSLYKYLAFIDFTSLEEKGRPVFDLTYLAMDYGPVPKEVYDNRGINNSEYYSWEKLEENRFLIREIKTPSIRYFSKYEISLMNRLIKEYAERFSSSQELSDYSHEKIIAWKRGYQSRPNKEIDFVLAFMDMEDRSVPPELEQAFSRYQILAAK